MGRIQSCRFLGIFLYMDDCLFLVQDRYDFKSALQGQKISPRRFRALQKQEKSYCEKNFQRNPQIRILPMFQVFHFQAVIDVWNYVFKRTYAYYDLAGEAYVKYLGLCGDEPVSGTISASLKILHLTINHTMELQVRL